MIFLYYFHAALGDTLWHRYHFARAALFLNHDAKFTMGIGNYYFNGGAYDLDKAEYAYEKAVAADPKILWGHYQLARIYFVEGDFDHALKEINLELAANPENLRSLYVRGLIYGYRWNLDEAEADFKRFTAWAPQEWAGYNDLAWVLSKGGEYQQAKDTIRMAFREISDAKQNPWLWNSLGVAELNLGNYGGAAQAFKKANELAMFVTAAEWRKSYPGNSPASADGGLTAFQEAIGQNLNRARSRVSGTSVHK